MHNMMHNMQGKPEMRELHRAQGMAKAGFGWIRCARGILTTGILLTAWIAQPLYMQHVQASQDTFGELDSFTGELIAPADGGSGAGTGQTGSGRIWITDTMYY